MRWLIIRGLDIYIKKETKKKKKKQQERRILADATNIISEPDFVLSTRLV